MPFSDLRSFVDHLRSTKELVEISTPVDPKLEIAEIHRRVIAEEGPALLFRSVRGSAYPVVTNLFGTRSRVEAAFGSEGPGLVSKIARLPIELMPPTIGSLWKHRGVLGRLGRTGIRTASSSGHICQRPAKLSALPILTTWHKDGGPFVTLPLVYTEHPEHGTHNLGMYRIQRFDDETTGLHMQIGKGGGFHLAEAKRLGRRLPINIFLGGPPVAILAAIAPLPENVPELLLGSLLLGKRFPLARHPASPLPVLEQAEFVLVGSCDANEQRLEGPFGDHYGYYSLAHDYPVFRCDAVLSKPGAIYPATVVGKPRQEDYYIGNYLQELLSPLFPVVMPSVLDLWSYGETGYHSLAAAVVRERYKREAMMSAFRILGEGQLSLTKFLLVLDKPMDLKNFTAVLEHVLERCDFRSDVFVFSQLSMDTLDYTGPKVNEGSKGVMLGCGEPIRQLPGEFHGQPPAEISQVRVVCRGCLAVSGPSFSRDPNAAERVAEAAVFADWPLVVLVDDASRAAENEAIFLWTTFTRFEPAADLHARKTSLHRYHTVLEPPLVIDARMKPWYPEEVECDVQTARLVETRWKEYFPRAFS